MKTIKTYLLLILTTGLMAGSCEKDSPLPVVDTNPFHRIMFYNVENLFDTLDQPGTADEEFMPGAEKAWNTSKLFDKLDKISKVIKDAGEDNWPALIGFCEVENRDVLEMLLAATDMKEADYEIVHKDPEPQDSF